MIIINTAIESMIELILGPHRHFLVIPAPAFLSDFLLDFGMVIQTFLIDHILKSILGGFEVVPSPVKVFLVHRLLLLVVQAIKVRVGYVMEKSYLGTTRLNTFYLG